MLNKFIAIPLMVVLMGVASVPAQAAEERLMIGWPKQRAAHDDNIAHRAAAYDARGKVYTEHLYATGGETPIEADMSVGTGFQQDIQPVPLNMGQIADLVKQQAGDGLQNADGTPVNPSPAKQTGATPQ